MNSRRGAPAWSCRPRKLEHHHARSENLTALLSRLNSTCLMRVGSASTRSGTRGSIVDVQRQRLLLRLRPHQRVDFAQQFAQVDGAVGHRHAPGFEQRHVEDVVEDGQQVVGRFGGGAQVVDLARVQPGIAQQRQHAQQAMERGADLVAHVGQERALGLARRFGLAPRLAQPVGQVDQRLLTLTELTHLAHHHQREDQRQHRQAHDQQQPDLVVLAHRQVALL